MSSAQGQQEGQPHSHRQLPSSVDAHDERQLIGDARQVAERKVTWEGRLVGNVVIVPELIFRKLYETAAGSRGQSVRRQP
jgi:hypothetical protein